MIQGVNSSNSPAPLKKKKKMRYCIPCFLRLIADVWNEVCAGRQLSLFGPTGADPPGLSIRAGALHQLQLWSLQVSQSGFVFFFMAVCHIVSGFSLCSPPQLCISFASWSWRVFLDVFFRETHKLKACLCPTWEEDPLVLTSPVLFSVQYRC